MSASSLTGRTRNRPADIAHAIDHHIRSRTRTARQWRGIGKGLGYTEAALRARGVTPTLLVELAAYGYVVARPETMKAAGKIFGFMRFVITDSGRTAIG